ncbi:hypothetical protein MP631_17585 [Xanthomonas phaseoli pv. phaseoli]|nr:hypothetical protein MP631_17585 [Xanthomonas phaseoli pv. phaseoli]
MRALLAPPGQRGQRPASPGTVQPLRQQYRRSGRAASLVLTPLRRRRVAGISPRTAGLWRWRSPRQLPGSPWSPCGAVAIPPCAWLAEAWACTGAGRRGWSSRPCHPCPPAVVHLSFSAPAVTVSHPGVFSGIGGAATNCDPST